MEELKELLSYKAIATSLLELSLMAKAYADTRSEPQESLARTQAIFVSGAMLIAAAMIARESKDG